MAEIESAWEKHPGYRIDLVPVKGVARAYLGDLLLAESSAALRVIETDHVERLYFPESDVRFELLEENDHHSVCPFKGEADYWSLTAGSTPVEPAIGSTMTAAMVVAPWMPTMRSSSSASAGRSSCCAT